MKPEVCPTCGANVPRRAKACPECGACESTGWSDEAYADGLGLPDDSFDYDEFVRKEFGTEKPSMRPHGINKLWWTVAVVLLAVMIMALVRHWL